MLGINLVPAEPFWVLISLFLSFVLSFLINYTIGTFAFWFVRTDGVRRAVYLFTSICSGAFLPLNLFPYSFQKLLFYLPFQFIAYVPVRVFIGQYELAGITMSIPQIVFLQAVMVAVMFLVNRALWYMGHKTFYGGGSRLGENSETRTRNIRFSAAGVYIQGVKTALASRMAYRGDFIMSMLIMMIVEFGGPVITLIIYNNGASFRAGTSTRFCFCREYSCCPAELPFPSSWGLYGSTIGRVRKVPLIWLLIKPRSILLMTIVTGFDSEDLGKLIGGILVFRYALKNLPVQPASHWVSFLILFVFSLILMFAFALFMAGLGIVWVGNYRI